VREPVGVVGCITPWNYPLHQICAKVAPALAAGCTVVSSRARSRRSTRSSSPRSSTRSGCPAGVFNLVPGYGPVVGEAIAAHPDVDMVSFTGSTRAGKRVSEVASQTVKRVALELGGKSPNVILDDADLDMRPSRRRRQVLPQLGPDLQRADAHARAARAAAGGRADRRQGGAEHFPVGDPFEPGHALGPLVSDAQRERVRGYIRRASRRARSWPAAPSRPRGSSAATSCSRPSSPT
jgi:aldehyde dehydrogenase (NAD+)